MDDVVKPRLALYQPDIPQNTGTMMRMAACFGIAMDIVEPCGFILSDKNLRRAGMDYLDKLDWQRHDSFNDFRRFHQNRRVILMTTKTDLSFLDFTFAPTDIILAGRESSGVDDDVHQKCDAHVTIPMAGGGRSLNVALAAAIVVSEALKQTGLFSP